MFDSRLPHHDLAGFALWREHRRDEPAQVSSILTSRTGKVR